MPDGPVVLLTGDGDSGRIGAHYLAARFDTLRVVVEQPVPRATFLRRRLRSLGPLTVAGQLAFLVCQRFQERASRHRIAAILDQYKLVDRWPEGAMTRVSSVNGDDCVALLRALQPAVVLVTGTRLIARAVLQSIDAPFINYHAGITPKYRGVHGGYWALAEDDAAHCGVTIHLVDAGIDTGAALYQELIAPTEDDNFSTYPYLQLATALPLLERAAQDALAGRLVPRKADLPSRLWSHPTIWRYLSTGLRRRVW